MNVWSKDMDVVMARLDALEERNGGLLRQNRLLKVVAALSVLVVGALLFTGAAMNQPAEVKAERFVLVNGKGNGRALLTTMANTGEPILELRDAEGKIRVSLSVSEDGPSLMFFDGNGKRDAQLAAYDHSRSLFLMDENGVFRVSLEVTKDGAELKLRDEKGKVIWSVPTETPPTETVRLEDQ